MQVMTYNIVLPEHWWPPTTLDFKDCAPKRLMVAAMKEEEKNLCRQMIVWRARAEGGVILLGL